MVTQAVPPASPASKTASQTRFNEPSSTKAKGSFPPGDKWIAYASDESKQSEVYAVQAQKYGRVVEMAKRGGCSRTSEFGNGPEKSVQAAIHQYCRRARHKSTFGTQVSNRTKSESAKAPARMTGNCFRMGDDALHNRPDGLYRFLV